MRKSDKIAMIQGLAGELGKTAYAISKETGITPPTVQKILHGTVDNPMGRNLDTIIDFLLREKSAGKLKVAESIAVEAEYKTLKRFENAQKATKALQDFFARGFKSFDALKAIVLYYFPEITEVRLWDFWNQRISDDDIIDALDKVYENLKSE